MHVPNLSVKVKFNFTKYACAQLACEMIW